MADTTPRTARSGGAKPTSADDSLETQLHAIRAEVAAMADLMGSFVKERVGALGESAEVAAEAAAQRARKARDRVEQGIGDAEKALDHRVQEHPLQSILMAFGLGVLISLLLRR